MPDLVGLDHYLTAPPAPDLYEIVPDDVVCDETDLRYALQSAEWERQRANDAERREASLTGVLRETQAALKAALSRVETALGDQVCPF
jgi:hypothetical protein